MLIIDSIRIRNFRAIKEARLAPLKEGITGIFGSNGSGKTTFLTALLFALYGVKPANVSVGALRREGSDGEECSISVVFQHMGQTVEVIKEIQGKNNRVLMWIYVDGIEIATTSVGEPQEWIKKRLGIDAEGFTTAFVVRQKELDSLVSAKPAPRKALIERLAGIETINVALKKARENENVSKRALGEMNVSLEDYEKAELNFNESETFITKLLEEYTIGKTKTEKAENNFEKLFDNLSRSKETINYLDSLKNKKEAKETELSELKQRLKISEERLSGITEKDVQNIAEELQNLDKKLVEARDTFNEKKVSSASSEAQIVSLTQEKETHQNFVKPEQEITETEEELNISVENTEKELSETIDKLADTKSAIKMNESHTELVEHGSCPTCKRDWDNPESEKKKTEKEHKKLIQQKDDLTEKITVLREKLKTQKSSITKLVSYANLMAEYDAKQKRVEIIDTLIEELSHKILAPEKLNQLIEDGKKLSLQRDAQQRKFVEAESSLTFVKEVESLRIRVNEAVQDLEKVTQLHVDKEKTRPDISEIEIEVREARIFRDKVRNELEIMKRNFDEANKKHYAVKSVFETIAHEWNKKQNAYKKHQIRVATTDFIDNFRKDAIARLAPELSDHATNLISEMTSGAFTEIILDDDFTPSVVTAAGVIRPVAWLSGGEESAVALALRLAIAFLITNNNPELLWLDEVLTAQDADRRSSMLGMVRRLPISQILLINHTQEASDVVDKVVTVIPDSISGSTLEE